MQGTYGGVTPSSTRRREREEPIKAKVDDSLPWGLGQTTETKSEVIPRVSIRQEGNGPIRQLTTVYTGGDVRILSP